MTTLTSIPTLWQLHPEFCREVVWRASNSDDALLCQADVDGRLWSVMLNSVDATALYGLYVGGRHVLNFEDWPGFWRWPS